MTPALSDLADRAETIHHRDLDQTVTDLYRYETEAGPLTQADLLDLVDAVARQQIEDGRVGAAQMAGVYRAQVRDETLAFKAYLLAVGRRRRLFQTLIAEAERQGREGHSDK